MRWSQKSDQIQHQMLRFPHDDGGKVPHRADQQELKLWEESLSALSCQQPHGQHQTAGGEALFDEHQAIQ